MTIQVTTCCAMIVMVGGMLKHFMVYITLKMDNKYTELEALKEHLPRAQSVAISN